MTRLRLVEDGPDRFRSGATGLLETGDEAEVNDQAAETLSEKDYLEVVEEDGFSEDEWLSVDYEERVNRVESGEYDDHLDEIEAVETSQNVIDVVQERREE